jgi:hypothetical protein
MSAAAPADMRVRAVGDARFPGLDDVYIAEYGFKLHTAALWTFDKLALPFAHLGHYIEFFIALLTFQIIERHVVLPPSGFIGRSRTGGNRFSFIAAARDADPSSLL